MGSELRDFYPLKIKFLKEELFFRKKIKSTDMKKADYKYRNKDGGFMCVV